MKRKLMLALLFSTVLMVASMPAFAMSCPVCNKTVEKKCTGTEGTRGARHICTITTGCETQMLNYKNSIKCPTGYAGHTNTMGTHQHGYLHSKKTCKGYVTPRCKL